jgi:hypothetical protein
MRLAQNVSVEHEELEPAGLQLLEDIRVGDNGAIILGIYGDVQLTSRFFSDRVPQLSQNPREEPGASAAHAGICARGRGAILVLPRPTWAAHQVVCYLRRTGRIG